MIRTRKRRCKEFFDNPTQVEVHREVQPQAPGPLHGLVLHPRISHRPGPAHREGARAGPAGESRGGWRGAGWRGGKSRRRARGRGFGWCGAASFRGRCGGGGAAGAPRERTSSIPTRDLPPHLTLLSPGGIPRATPPRGLSQRPQKAEGCPRGGGDGPGRGPGPGGAPAGGARPSRRRAAPGSAPSSCAAPSPPPPPPPCCPPSARAPVHGPRAGARAAPLWAARRARPKRAS